MAKDGGSMNTTLLKRVRKNFCSPDLPREYNRAHIRKWVKIVRYLGPKWRLANPIDFRRPA